MKALALLLLSAPFLLAQEIEERAPAPEQYRTLWENSPFTRPLNAAESYAITGVIRIDQKPVVTMLNTATGERFSLSTDGNAQGWRLIELRSDPNPRNVMAVVSINGEEVAVRFNDGQLSPEALTRATEAARQPVPQSASGSRFNQRNNAVAPPRREQPSKSKNSSRNPSRNSKK